MYKAKKVDENREDALEGGDVEARGGLAFGKKLSQVPKRRE